MTIRVEGGTCALVRSSPTVPGPASEHSNYDRTPHITYVDQAIMRAYFQRHDSALPGAEIPNQTSSKANGKMRLLPDALERKLSVLPANYLRALSGDSVLLVETVTHTVIDRMRNVRSKSEWGTMQHRAGYESANSAA